MLIFKKVVFRLLCNQVTGFLISFIFRNKIPNLRGGKFSFFVDEKLVNARQMASIFWGFYERAERQMIDKYLSSDLDVIELGSSVGVVSSHIGAKLRPGKKLIGVEANPKLINLLNENIKKHLASGAQFFICNAAIDYEKSEVALSITNNNTETRVVPNSQQTTNVVVKATRLDLLLKQYDILNYTLVCDIEGAEIGLLLNESNSLKTCSHLFIELHKTHHKDEKYDVDSLVRMIIQKHGFLVVEHHGPVYYFSRPN